MVEMKGGDGCWGSLQVCLKRRLFHSFVQLRHDSVYYDSCCLWRDPARGPSFRVQKKERHTERDTERERRQQLLAAALPRVHACSRTRARGMAELWNLLAIQEAEHIVDVPVSQIMEEIVNAIETAPKEHTSERVLEQFVEAFDEPVPPQEEIVEVIPLPPHISECTQIVDIPVPQVLEELQERFLEHMNEQIVDVPVPKTVDQPGDHVCQDPTDSTHRQSCRCACGVAATGQIQTPWKTVEVPPAQLWMCL